jgi:4-amino-4-deoxy-L-arabinose transferase-like glycosyltransferase
MNPKSWLFTTLALLTVLRIWMTGSMELAPDESYYYLWSQHPDVCYFSKGPGVAAAIRLGTDLLGATEHGVRFLSPLLSLATSLLMFLLARRLFSETVAVWTALAMNFLPILQVGSVVMTIDPLSIFFWTAALFSFWLALERDSSAEDHHLGPGWSKWWLVTGFLIGMGFLCKWTNAMQLVSILIVLLSCRRMRRHFVQPGFWLMLLVFLIFLLPPVLWNAQHQWITFSHLTHRGGLNEPFQIHIGEPFAFLGAHAGVYSPLLFIAILLTLWRELPRAKDHFKPRFLIAFTLPLFLLYAFLSLKKAGEANWTAPAMVSAGILATADWYERARRSHAVRRFLGIGLGFGLVMSVLILNIDLLRSSGLPYPYKRDPTTRLRGWETAARAVEKVRAERENISGAPLFLIADGRGLASSIGFYLKDKRMEGPGHPPIYTPESQAIEDQFAFWPRYDQFISLKQGQRAQGDPLYTEEAGFNPFHGRSALFITDSEGDTAPSSITGGFEKAELIACFDLERRGWRLRQLRIFECKNYHSRAL